MNFAADILSRLERDPNEKRVLKVIEDVPTQPIELIIEPKGFSREELVFFDTTDQHEETEKQFLKRTEETRPSMPTDPSIITVSCHYGNI